MKGYTFFSLIFVFTGLLILAIFSFIALDQISRYDNFLIRYIQDIINNDKEISYFDYYHEIPNIQLEYLGYSILSIIVGISILILGYIEENYDTIKRIIKS